MARISGPYEGFYIAARAQQIESGWMGEARVFSERPTTFDDQSSVAKLGGDHSNSPSELDAVENAERVARDWIMTNQRLYVQFELARSVYAWHQVLLVTTAHMDLRFVAQKIEEATVKFVENGGVAKTGVGPLGDKGPVLETSDGNEVPYSAGSTLAVHYGQILRSR